jgi:hypothetical protein
LDVVVGRAVEGRVNDLAVDRTLHVGDLFRPLVDQEDDEVDLRIVRADRVGDLLHHGRLPSLRRADDHAALSLPDRCDQVDDARRDLARVLELLEAHPLLWIERRQVTEARATLGILGLLPVDLVDLE